MKKKYGIAVIIAALTAVFTAGYGTKEAENAASVAGGTTTAMSSTGESAASDTTSKGESAASEGGKKLTDFKTEDFKTGDDITAQAEATVQMLAEEHGKLTVADGTYQVNVTLSGGSGRAKITSPTELTVEDGRATTEIVWSNDKYDYMEVEGIRFTPEIQNSHSIFMVSIMGLGKPLAMVGSTTAMGTPHTIDYQLTFELQKQGLRQIAHS